MANVSVCLSLDSAVSIKPSHSIPGHQVLPSMYAKASLQKQVSDCELCYCHANPSSLPESLSPIFVSASCRRSCVSSTLISKHFTSVHHLSNLGGAQASHLFYFSVIRRVILVCGGPRKAQCSGGTLQRDSKPPGSFKHTVLAPAMVAMVA